jgi:uncharacterized protein (UPF0548 family)
MFLTGRPSQQDIDRFIRESEALPLSYSPAGITRTTETDTRHRHYVDDATLVIGHGAAAFERARAALMAWKAFDVGWIETFPPAAPIETGTVVAVLIRHLGFWSLNGCRVVYSVGSLESATHVGFAYGTLTNHAESGEELFEVILDPRTDEVTYRIHAISWPQTTLARLGLPFVRVLQKRFREQSAAALTRAVIQSRC